MGKARWSDDQRGHGVADARPYALGISELLGAAEAEDWVAEEPEKHLFPHIQRACESLPLKIISTQVCDDGCYDVTLQWTGEFAGQGAVRAAVFSLIGSFAEGRTYVRQQQPIHDESLVFEVVTGLLEGDGSFGPHGHALIVAVLTNQ